MEECREKFGRKKNGSLAKLVRSVKWVKCICNQQVEQGEGASIEIQTSCLVLAYLLPLKCFYLIHFQQMSSFGTSQSRAILFSRSCSSRCSGGNLTEKRQQVNLPSTCLGVVSGLPSITEWKYMSERNGLFVTAEDSQICVWFIFQE